MISFSSIISYCQHADHFIVPNIVCKRMFVYVLWRREYLSMFCKVMFVFAALIRHFYVSALCSCCSHWLLFSI